MSPSERAALQAKRKEIYERLHPETKAGGDRKSKSQLEILNKSASYIDVASADEGRSRATVAAREVHRGASIPEIAAIPGTSLDKGVELDALATLPADQQASLIAKAKAGKKVSAKPRRSVRQSARGKREKVWRTRELAMLLADPLIRSRDIKLYAAEFSAITLHRHILAGRFPSPAATINGLRSWRRSDLIAWRDGRRSGWPPDLDITARRERMALVRAARHTESHGHKISTDESSPSDQREYHHAD